MNASSAPALRSAVTRYRRAMQGCLANAYRLDSREVLGRKVRKPAAVIAAAAAIAVAAATAAAAAIAAAAAAVVSWTLDTRRFHETRASKKYNCFRIKTL